MIIVIMTMVPSNLTSSNLGSTPKTIFHTKSKHLHALVQIFKNMDIDLDIHKYILHAQV